MVLYYCYYLFISFSFFIITCSYVVTQLLIQVHLFIYLFIKKLSFFLLHIDLNQVLI